MKGVKLLLVDDEPSLRRMLGQILAARGYAVLEASSGEEALSLLEDHAVDAFLLDIGMEDLNGIELCRQIRSRRGNELCPVIFLTGEDERTHLEAALNAGGNDFISKPFDAALVETRLKGHIERVRYFVQLNKAHELLRHYVSDATAGIIESSVSGTLPGVEVRDVAVCFTDIRGFTALSEELDPLQLFAALNDHISDQVEQVHSFGGYIDKFCGDGLMAVFEGPDKEVRGCLSALAISDGARSRKDTLGRGIHEIGIGIHSGPVVIGNIGSEERLDYTVIGSTVNLAARLCGEAEAGSIVVSNVIRHAVGFDDRFRFLLKRDIPIRGFTNGVTVHTLLRPLP